MDTGQPPAALALHSTARGQESPGSHTRGVTPQYKCSLHVVPFQDVPAEAVLFRGIGPAFSAGARAGGKHRGAVGRLMENHRYLCSKKEDLIYCARLRWCDASPSRWWT